LLCNILKNGIIFACSYFGRQIASIIG